jgi:tetratricopeptide (TPR) repeat protein
MTMPHSHETSYSIKIEPSKIESSVLHGVAISAFKRGDIEVALKFLSRACTDPEAPAIWHRNYAEMLDRRGNSEAAEMAARLAIRRDPDCASAWDTLGTILVQRGLLEESCDCYETAVRIDPNFVQALNNLAVTLDRMGQLESAEERYRQVLRLVPENANIHLNFAALLGELGRHQEGLEIAWKVRDRYPNMMRTHSIIAEFKGILKRRRATPSRLRRSLARRRK